MVFFFSVPLNWAYLFLCMYVSYFVSMHLHLMCAIITDSNWKRNPRDRKCVLLTGQRYFDALRINKTNFIGLCKWKSHGLHLTWEHEHEKSDPYASIVLHEYAANLDMWRRVHRKNENHIDKSESHENHHQ